jgi:predicted metal-dependent hydrolase
MRFALKRGPERLSVEMAGRRIPVAVKRNTRARRLILRIDPASGLPVVTLPARTSLAQAEAFLRGNTAWIETRLDRSPSPIPFRDGAVFPLRGEPCRILHRGGRGLVRLEEAGQLCVPGQPEHVSRRVTEWLKREARRDFSVACARHSGALGKPYAAIRIGDAGSRWGSCSSSGVLTFSWRLVMAPPHVLDYLAAHEVAHLAEMNHGPRFWAHVERLDPEHKRARSWLKAHGAALHAIGRAIEPFAGSEMSSSP